MNLALLERMLAARRARAGVALVTELESGAQCLISGADGYGELALEEGETSQIDALIRADRSQLLETGERRLFVEVWSAPLRLIVVGAVHTAQSLVQLAQPLGFELTLVDPRAAFATEARFPGIALLVEWPETAVPRLAPDRRTALVTLTHNPRIDDPALLAALGTEAFYIGALGSRRTHEQRRERLGREGLEAAALKRIHAPIGLAIGASTPSEIAVSILAEIVAVLRGAPLAARV